MATEQPQTRRQITLERRFDAPLDAVWQLWTTREGIESWWGPEGFSVRVHRLELRPGGELEYYMTATAPEQAEFLKKAGMPLTQKARVVFTEIVPRRRLAFTQKADFIPGVKPYDVATGVEFEESAQGVRLLMTFDAMHDEQWTRLAVMGWESELGKLAKALQVP
jgi:uncharacterized protein YndB with AHSA1/START domain